MLFHLAWLGFAAREGRQEIAAIEAKGRDFDEDDARAVLEAGRDACAKVLPLYRRLWADYEAGQGAETLREAA